MKEFSCSKAEPAITLPRNTFTRLKRLYLLADLLSRDDRDMKPSNLDMIISIVGRKRRKSFNTIPGRQPWMKDLTKPILVIGLRKGATHSIPSTLARDCTKAMGIMEKKVRKKNATAIISFLILRSIWDGKVLPKHTPRLWSPISEP